MSLVAIRKARPMVGNPFISRLRQPARKETPADQRGSDGRRARRPSGTNRAPRPRP